MASVNCSEHGEQQETFVCQHICRGLEKSVPYGFWWAEDIENPRPDAWCTMCNELVTKSVGEWTDEILAIAQIKLLCGACYDEAKAMNVGEESNNAGKGIAT